MDPAALAAAVSRSPVNDDGRSGATLERLELADGQRVVVKRFDPATDLVMQLTGDTRGREVDFFLRGVLDDLPQEVAHAVVAGWFDDDGTGVLVMRDLGDGVLGWGDRLDAVRARTVLGAVAAMHGAFLGRPPADLTPLDSIVDIFAPERLRPLAGAQLVDLALRGWELWPEVAPGPVGEQVLALVHDPAPLLAALAGRPATLLHGDLATVNMALEPDRPGTLTLIDWGIAAAGPPGLDIGRFLAGCAHLIDLGLEEQLALYREVAGPSYDEAGVRLGLLSGIVWLGWNKALDIVDHPAAHVRAREAANLPWWLEQAELALDSLG